MTKYTLLFVLLVSIVACAPLSEVSSPAANPKVILIVGDGMDDQQITMGRNYLHGNAGRLVMDDMPYRGAAQVRTVAEDDPLRPVYVGDSASGGTALATGVVTSVGRIGTTANNDEDVVTIMELAQAAGLRTGIATTSTVVNATPAAFLTHVGSRYCTVPRMMVFEDEQFPQDSADCSDDYIANGGAGSIAEQLAVSNIDILLGGGSRAFDEFIEGSETTSILQLAQQNGFRIARNLDDLADVPATEKILGLFSPGTMPVKSRGSGGRKAEFIERDENGVVWPEPFACEDNPGFANTPTLAGMTRSALAHLGEDSGFMLMIESASIDKEAHDWRPCGSIGEVGQLDEALQVALDYARNHPETLILVTADHGHGAHITPQIADLALQGFATPGRFARVMTPEGGVMGVNYATTDSPHWEEHSGVQVPVYGYGPGVTDLPNYLHQGDIFHIAAKHLGLDNNSSPR